MLATGCSSNKDKLIISGANKITTYVNYSGEEDYQVIDVKTTESVIGTWSLKGTDSIYFSIDKKRGLLTWTSNSLTIVKDYKIALEVSYNNMNTKKDIVISNLADPLPTATHITIYGSNNLLGQSNIANHSDYVCTDNNGHRIVGAQWSLSNNPSWLSIDNNGLVQWTNGCDNGTYNFIIHCNRQGLEGASLNVQLVITVSIVVPTSISIYGSAELTGVGGIAGLSDYVSIDNNGHKVSDGVWTISKNNGCDGVSVDNNGCVHWSQIATGGTFTLTCNDDGLTGSSEIITLTIYEEPKFKNCKLNIAGWASDPETRQRIDFWNDGYYDTQPNIQFSTYHLYTNDWMVLREYLLDERIFTLHLAVISKEGSAVETASSCQLNVQESTVTNLKGNDGYGGQSNDVLQFLSSSSTEKGWRCTDIEYRWS